jgi:hypothetical protein
MDLVLGLSATSTAVRWVLVEGWTGDGAPVDRGVLDITDVETFDADALLTVLLDANEAVVESGVHAVGVTWTADGDVAATAILAALEARELNNVVSISETEAAEALACGIADIAGYQDTAVCIYEPDATLVAVVDADGVTVDRKDRPTDGTDDIELTSSVIALDLNDRQLDAIFVVGSTELEPAIAELGTVAAAPVISAAEADMAMARGAAVASALAVNDLDSRPAPLLARVRGMSKASVLTSVLVAASVTLVISLAVALGLSAGPDSKSEKTQNANATGEQVKEATVPTAARIAEGAPKLDPAPAAKPSMPVPSAPRPAPQAIVAQTMIAPPPAAVPDYEPPAAAAPVPEYVPPAPAYVPPPPAYVPPAQPQVPAVQPKPRLRDQIIERIPIINRFHDPQYEYPGN